MNNVALSNNGLRELALFAGAGGGILGGHLLGWKTVCAVEIEDYPRRVLLARQRDGILPRFPIWDDIKTFDGKPWRGRVDVVSGGFPCQDISSQGDNHQQSKGIDGDRSGLWSEMARVICEIRPQYVFVENSPNLVIRGLDRVLGDLAKMGYDAKWGVLGACDVGYDHRRERIWIVATRVWQPVVFAADLPECECCGEPWCDQCNKHYADCSCPGPTSDEHEYSECGMFAKAIADTCSIRSLQRNRSNQERQGEAKAGSVERLCEVGLRHDIPAPNAFGDANGVANRMVRLKAIGNGQVPAVAALAWQLLTQDTQP